MAAFGNSLASVNVQNQAEDLVYQAAIDRSFTPSCTSAFGIAAAVIQSMLNDAVPLAAGASATPGLAFISDSDTGFFRVGANEIGVACSGANVGGFTSSGIKLGSTSSTVMTKFVVYSVSLTPAAVVNVSGVSEVTATVTGVTVSDNIFVNPPAVSNNVVALSWRVSASDTVTAAWLAFASVSSTPAAGTYHVVAVRNA